MTRIVDLPVANSISNTDVLLIVTDPGGQAITSQIQVQPFLEKSGSGLSVSNTAPIAPQQGAQWLDTRTGILYTYVIDADSSSWVEAGPTNVLSPEPNFNLDGGEPASDYGGISAIDAGEP